MALTVKLNGLPIEIRKEAWSLPWAQDACCNLRKEGDPEVGTKLGKEVSFPANPFHLQQPRRHIPCSCFPECVDAASGKDA